ncbi:hypothetical protein K8I31_02020, partial [bacterium]|nr:hypothetical protein [bacterium]
MNRSAAGAARSRGFQFLYWVCAPAARTTAAQAGALPESILKTIATPHWRQRRRRRLEANAAVVI